MASFSYPSATCYATTHVPSVSVGPSPSGGFISRCTEAVLFKLTVTVTDKS